MQPTIAVVGAGKWGQNLIKTFANLGVLSAIVDSDFSRSQAFASQYHVPCYQDVDELLAQDIDAVAIATPVFTHYQLAKKFLLAKKDVFVEKPITRTVTEAEDLLRLASLNQCVLMVGHLLLYQPGITFIKNFLDEQKLGEIFSIRQIRRSLGTIRKEENVLYSLGVHDIAVLDYFFQEPIQKIIASSQQVIATDIADEMNIHLQYSTGKQAHVHLNWLWPIKDRQLMILGERGALHFDETTQEVIYHQNYGKKDSSIVQMGSEIIFKDSTPPLSLELKHFIDCILERKTPRSCGYQGRNVVELMAKIMAAQETHSEQLLYT